MSKMEVILTKATSARRPLKGFSLMEYSLSPNWKVT